MSKSPKPYAGQQTTQLAVNTTTKHKNFNKKKKMKKKKEHE
jgi:hypothetical protein